MRTRLTVLIVEDQAPEADLVLYELRRAGFEPQWVRVDTEPAFLAHLEPPPDVILAGDDVPQFDAARALRVLSDSGLDIPLIVVAGSGSEEAAVESMQQGAADYLSRGRLARLGMAVTHALEQKALRDARRKADEWQRRRKRRFRAIVENSPDVIALLDADGTCLYAGPSIERVLGHSADDLVGRNALEVFHPDDRAPLGEALAGLIRQRGRIALGECRALHKDGAWRWLDGTAENLLNDPDVRAVVTIYRDITDRKQAEEALRQALARYAAVLESTFNAIITIDHEGTVVEFNTAAERMFGYSRTEALGKALSDLIILPDLREEHQQGLLRYLTTGEGAILGRRVEMRAVRADGSEFPVELMVTRIPIDGQALFCGCIRDLPAQPQTEKALPPRAQRPRRRRSPGEPHGEPHSVR